MKTALLVIDAQRIYTDKGSELYCSDSIQTTKRINKLIDSFKKSGELVVYVRHVHKKDGTDLGNLWNHKGGPIEDFQFKEGSSDVEYTESLHRIEGAPEITKTRYSSFPGTTLASILADAEIQRVAICGFMTNFCCESTAREALDRNFFVDFIVDATGSPGTENYDESRIREIVGELLSAGFSRVFSTKDYLLER